MKAITSTLLAMLLAAHAALADEQKPAKKSDKNAAQKAEAATGKFLRDNKIWTKSEPRGTGASQPKPARKDQNAAQKAETSVGKWANDNKIWITHPDKSGKKSEK